MFCTHTCLTLQVQKGSVSAAAHGAEHGQEIGWIEDPRRPSSTKLRLEGSSKKTAASTRCAAKEMRPLQRRTPAAWAELRTSAGALAARAWARRRAKVAGSWAQNGPTHSHLEPENDEATVSAPVEFPASASGHRADEGGVNGKLSRCRRLPYAAHRRPAHRCSWPPVRHCARHVPRLPGKPQCSGGEHA